MTSTTVNTINTINDPIVSSLPQVELTTTKVKPSIPYQLDFITERLGEVFINAATARKMLLQAYKNPSVTAKQREYIKNAVKKLDEANKAFLEIPQILSDAFNT